MKVRECMHTDVACCLNNESLEVAAAIMRSGGIGFVPVLDAKGGRRVAGVITDRDIALATVSHGSDLRLATVGECMARDPVCCRETDTIETLLRTMEQHKLRRIPVVDRRNQLCGVITLADLVKRDVLGPASLFDLVQAVYGRTRSSKDKEKDIAEELVAST